MKGLKDPLPERKEEYDDSEGEVEKKKIDKPCRRTCSSIHNPMFHINRLGKNNSLK